MKELDIDKAMNAYYIGSIILGALLMTLVIRGFINFTDKVHNEGLKSIVQGLWEGQVSGNNK